MQQYIENKIFSELTVGDTASASRTLNREDIDLFAALSGDVNPAHVDEAFAQSDMFHAIVGHGMWAGALISSVLGTQLPGPGTIYLEQTLHFVAPVKVGDSVTATVTVQEKREGKHVVLLECVCTNQHGQEVVRGKAVVIAPQEKVKRPRVALPAVAFKGPPHPGYYEKLIALKDSLSPLVTAVVHPVDEHSLSGAIEAAMEGLIRPVLVGPEHKIRAVAEAHGYDLSPYDIIPTQHSHEAAATAVEMARSGKVEALMKGKLHTQEFMAPIVAHEGGLRTERRMSHVFVVDVPNYHKPMFITDAALNIQPNLAAKRDIVQNAIDLFVALDMGTPKVAIVSAVETVDEKIPSTLDATALCKMAQRGQITGGLLDGPLGLDNALSREAADTKGIVSEVAGDADILIVPDVEAGNMLYKQLRYLSGEEGAGIVLGARVPVILTSRSAAGTARKASCALALVYARRHEKAKAAIQAA